MSRNTSFNRQMGLIIAASVLGSAALLSGCGNSEIDTSASMPSPGNSSTAKVAASGPAVTEPLKFDQLALESPVTRHKESTGQVFLRFSYADRQGRIYKCELPEPMSEGSYTIEEWARTFDYYKLPQVIGQKKITKKKGPAQIGDFPFISPKPAAQQQPSNAAPQPSPRTEGLPVTPPLPGASGSSSPSGSLPPVAPPPGMRD